MPPMTVDELIDSLTGLRQQNPGLGTADVLLEMRPMTWALVAEASEYKEQYDGESYGQCVLLSNGHWRES